MDNQLYDFTELKQVCGGDESFMEKMIGLFLTTIPDDIKKIEEALKGSDYTVVKSIAHKIKPSVNYMCKPHLFEDAKTIENWADNDENMISKTQKFISSLAEVINQIREFKESPKWD